METEGNIVLNCVFARVALTALNLLVEFPWAVHKTIKFSFKILFLKSEKNAWTHMHYVMIWNI